LGISDKFFKSFEAGSDVSTWVFLDISRAFDRVWHKGLLFKMRKLGLNNLILKWIESYLLARSQKVVLLGVESPVLPINAGVHQGSILGPLLFLIYINVIMETIASDMYIFEDDTTLAKEYKSVAYVENILNADLHTIAEWAKQWFVSYTVKKTAFLNFSLKKNKSISVLEFNDSRIKQEHDHKHLGIVLPDYLKWSKHIRHIVSKASQQLGALWRQTCKLSRTKLETIYLNMIKPSLEYGSVVFSGCSSGDSNKLDGVQRRASVLCSGGMLQTKTALLAREMGCEPMGTTRVKAKLLLFYKFCFVSTPPLTYRENYIRTY